MGTTLIDYMSSELALRWCRESLVVALTSGGGWWLQVVASSQGYMKAGLRG
jgi:hypothetical protein